MITEFSDINGNCKNNYIPNINMVGSCHIDISRDWLFINFVLTLNEKDFTESRSKEFINILKTFSTYGENTFPYFTIGLFNLESEYETSIKVKLVEILNWISKADVERALKRLVKDFKSHPYRSSESLFILSQSRISQLFWNYLGKDEYTKLYSLCEDFEIRNSKIRKLATISGKLLNSILETLNPIFEILHDADYPVAFRKHDKEDLPKRFDESLQTINKQIVSWSSFMNDELWLESPFDPELPQDLLSLLFLSSLIGLVSGNNSNIELETLLGFLDYGSAFKIALKNLHEKKNAHSLITYISKTILKNNSSIEQLKLVFDRVEEIFSEIYDEQILLA